VVGALMSIITEYYTAMGKRPVNSIVQQSATGHATNIIGGLAIGMESTVLPILVLAAGIVSSYYFAGLYGVAIAAAGMMATTAMQLAIDAFGPIADNAGGIAEMSGLPKEVRERTDNLDAVGNTTAAAGKGFAIASAALTSLALFAAFVGISGISTIDIYKAPVLAGLFVGAMIPFIFSALCISAVGRAAMAMVHEVRRQFREIPGIMEYKAKPEYQKCVAISTEASIREMMLPGAIALVVPVLVGFVFGPEVLGGLIAGVTVSGVLMGMFQSNAGGAWDNAKKSFEKGVEINGKMEYKGSDAHKASVTGDTVGDPFKDTSGPSMNILIKLMSIVSLVIAPHIADVQSMHIPKLGIPNGETSEVINTPAIEDGVYAVVSEETDLEWLGGKVYENHFGKISISEGSINVENGAIISGLCVVDMNSMTCADIKDEEKNANFIGHLKDDDFFSVNQFPTATLNITSVSKIDEEFAVVKGQLTIKGITNDISFPAKFITEGNTIRAAADFKVDRAKFDVRYGSKTFFDDLANKFIRDDIDFKINLVAKKA
jgi:K(+)-stimulated pyrophosphate-energized sodium pump